jgi:hypothetical protein
VNRTQAITALTGSVSALESAVGNPHTPPPPPPPPPPNTLPPLSYSAISDRVIRALPALPVLGPAGFQFTDPTYGSRILRVTDENTSPGYPKRWANMSSSAEQNSFNADSTRFYTNQAYVMVWTLDRAKFTVTPVMDPRKNAPLQLALNEPEWSFVDPDIMYFASAGRLQSYDLKTFSSSVLVDLSSVVPGYTGGSGAVSASRDDKVVTSCNGTSQDTYDTVVVHDRKTGTNRLINTRNCTIDGSPLNTTTPFSVGIHNVRIDKSGQYVRISVGSKFATLTAGVVFIVVDLTAGTAVFLDATNRGSGHAACGYGVGVNGEVPPGDYGPNVLMRSYDKVGSYTTLMPGPSPGPYIGGVDYLSWSNARAEGTFPVMGNDTVYKTANPYAGEIFALATDGSRKAWRFAHHRGRYTSADGFWSYPRATISPCGRYAIFMSNWERSLGASDAGKPRTDVFLLELPVP